MPEMQSSEPTPVEKRLDRQLLGSMALSIFAAAFEVIVGFSVAHWVTVAGTKRSGYSISGIAFCICLVAGWMALHVRRRVTGADETRPNQGRRLFMANLNLLAAGLVALVVIGNTRLDKSSAGFLMYHLTSIPAASQTLTLESEAHSAWSASWSWEPSIVLPLAFLFAVYALGAVRRGGWNTLKWRHSSFFSGWFALALALTSPIHELGEQLFSAHMLQHEILILLSAPLISAAHPAAICLWAFAARRRKYVGSWIHSVESTWLVKFITRPLTAWLLEALALWIWHVPAFYQATLRSDWVHAAQHLSFFLTAALFWSALYGAGRSAMGYGAATLYVFGTAVHCSALGALLTFSAVVWYPAYAATTQPWGLTPLEDQQLGGLIMWVPTAVIFILIGLVLFARWVVEAGSRQRHSSLQALLETLKGDPH